MDAHAHCDAVVLRAGNLEVGVAPACGASLTRFQVRTARGMLPVLRNAIAADIVAGSAYGASCFPLVPYAGRLRHGTFESGGRRIQFPLNVPAERHSSHGDGWQRPWRVQRLERDSVHLSISASEGDPLRYDAVQRIQVSQESLRVRFEITNREPDRLPVGVGLHPYFANRSEALVTAALPVRRRLDAELMPLGTDVAAGGSHLRPRHPVSELEGVNIFEGWDGQAEIAWPASGLAVQLTTWPRLGHAVIWAPSAQSFFCFEPVSHATNAFNSAAQCAHALLDPGETLVQRFELRLRVE